MHESIQVKPLLEVGFQYFSNARRIMHRAELENFSMDALELTNDNGKWFTHPKISGHAARVKFISPFFENYSDV